MRVAALFSGGKDSTFAVWKASEEHELVTLVAFEPGNPDSYMFHHPNIGLTALQADAMGIPLILVPTPGNKEEEVRDMEEALRDLPVEGVVAGALASEYQRSRVEKVCRNLGLKTLTPAWHMDPTEYWGELLVNGFRVLVTKVACEGLGKEWLGREVGREALEELKRLSEKHRFHLAFEGGEAETLVLDCPLFKKKLSVESAEVKWEGDSGTFLVRKAILSGK